MVYSFMAVRAIEMAEMAFRTKLPWKNGFQKLNPVNMAISREQLKIPT